MSEEFSWNENDAVVIPSVNAIAVYTNPAGNIVIRQEGTGYGDMPDDQIIVVPRNQVSGLIDAIKKEVESN